MLPSPPKKTPLTPPIGASAKKGLLASERSHRRKKSNSPEGLCAKEDLFFSARRLGVFTPLLGTSFATLEKMEIQRGRRSSIN